MGGKEIIHLPFDVDVLPVRQLQAGALQCLYEAGNLRYIKWGDTEIVRMLYAAVRDEGWNTAPYRIENEKIELGKAHFLISYTAVYKLNHIDYKADFLLEGRENKIVFIMKGEALSSFMKNRIGICVHHPIKECAGTEVSIGSPDGSRYTSIFPTTISPHQPFLAVQTMQWNVGDLHCSVACKGDVFETEDQRNWTDSSFKTYSTPLAIPFPVQVRKGDAMQQTIVLQVLQQAEETFTIKNNSTLNSTRLAFPEIGFSKIIGSTLSDSETELLCNIPFDHYRVDIHFKNRDWKEELLQGAADAKKLAAKLELVLFFSTNAEKEWNELMPELEEISLLVKSILPLGDSKITTAGLFKLIAASIRAPFPHIQIGWGTDLFFAELNRNRPSVDAYDFLSFSINPQVHLKDTRSLIENLEAQKDTISTITQFAEGKSVFISPLTFRIRADTATDGHMGSGYDERQHTSFGAWWILASIANLGGADQITLFPAGGANGILEKTAKGQHAPLYEALVCIKKFGPKWIRRDADSIIVENDKGDELVVVLNKNLV